MPIRVRSPRASARSTTCRRNTSTKTESGGRDGTRGTVAAGSPAGASGVVIHWAFAYDLLVWLAARGKERAYRQRLAQLARFAPGESVLDVGCGTGTLAIVAKQSVGPAGKVVGVDPSPEMIARARKKARKAAADVTLEQAAGERLPFPEATFAPVLSVPIRPHLPAQPRPPCLFQKPTLP